VMAVAQTRTLGEAGVALYTPFRGINRARSMVGTLDVDAIATGAAGGGTVSITLTARPVEFGFKFLWVPTRITLQDNLASVIDVELAITVQGNERLLGAYTEEVTMRATAAGDNIGNAEAVSIPIECDILAGASIMFARWATNTDAKTYHLKAFGPVYDMEFLAASKAHDAVLDTLVGGVR